MLIKFLLSLGIVYASLALLLWWQQERLIFMPVSELATTPAVAGVAYEDVWLETEDNSKIHGWHIPAQNAELTLLFFHGNAGNLSHRLSSLNLLHSLSVNILIIDYRGYGRSQGSVSEQNMYADAGAAWRYLTENKRIDPANIVIFGRSLGGAVAVNLGADVDAGGLILESTFTSLSDMGKNLYPFLPIELLLRYRFNSESIMSDVNSKVMFIHSRDDEIIPISMGKTLYNQIQSQAQWIEIFGSHNEGFIQSGDLYRNALKNFFSLVAETSAQKIP